MTYKINKNAVKAAFSKAAKHYDQHAQFQRDVGYQLLSIADNAKAIHGNMLDLGCGTGYFSQCLHDRSVAPLLGNTSKSITCFDLSPAMLEQTLARGIPQSNVMQGDIDNLPFTQPCFDFVYSNLVLQWSEALSSSLSQIHASLNKHGTLVFSTLLTDSLNELKVAWQSVDERQHVNEFLKESDILCSLKAGGFKCVNVTTQQYVCKFPDVKSVMRSLKGIGANHVHQDHKTHLSNRSRLDKLNEGYQPFRDKDGLYELSYQVCFVIAHKD